MLQHVILAVFFVPTVFPLEHGAVCRVACRQVCMLSSMRINQEDNPLSSDSRISDERVSFLLPDATRVTGIARHVDPDGIEGDFGSYLWEEMDYRDSWRLYRKMLKPGQPDAWIVLGGHLLLAAGTQARASTYAERAFRAATLSSPTKDTATAILGARQAARDELRRRAEDEESRNRAQMKTASPESGSWSAVPWPALDNSAREQARLSSLAMTRDMLQQGALALASVPSAHCTFLTNAERAPLARWMHAAEKTYEYLSRILGGDGFHPPFHGTLPIVILPSRDRFVLAESQLFNQLIGPQTQAICHYRGRSAFIFAAYPEPGQDLTPALVREICHAFLHGYGSPARLPRWAQEGLAEAVVSAVTGAGQMEGDARKEAVALVRRPGQFQEVLLSGWPAHTGTDRWAVDIGVCGLAFTLLLEGEPGSVRQWIRSCKRGENLRTAFQEAFGLTQDSFLKQVLAYYRVND